MELSISSLFCQVTHFLSALLETTLDHSNFAEKLTMTPGKMNKKDIESLKAFDFTESEISEIVQVVSYFNYINRVADGLGLEPEEFIDKLGYKKNIDE